MNKLYKIIAVMYMHYVLFIVVIISKPVLLHLNIMPNIKTFF